MKFNFETQMLKKISICLFFSNICFCAFADITITVKVKNASPNTSISIISEYYDLDKQPLEANELDKQGVGILKTTIKNKRFLIIDIGFKTVRMLVNPDKNYIITYDNKERNKIIFDGDNSKINSFIQECEKLISTFEYNRKTYIDWESLTEFPQGMNNLEELASKYMSAFFKNNTITQSDSRLLLEYINFELLFLKTNRYLSIFNSFYSSKQALVPLYYQNIVEQITFNDEYFKKGHYTYQFVLQDFLSIKSSLILTDKYKNWESFKEKFPSNFMDLYIEKELEIINELKIPTISKSYMIASVLNQIEKFSLYKKYFNICQKQLFGTPFIPILERKLEKLKFLESDIAFPQITGIDNLGSPIKMSNFKNKYLYIDIWATWCGPCIREIPASYKLQKYFEGRNDLLFLNISIDSDTLKWKQYISKNSQFIGKHINIDENQSASLMETLGIRGVPRYILVSKDGKIIGINAPKPSEIDVINYLENNIK